MPPEAQASPLGTFAVLSTPIPNAFKTRKQQWRRCSAGRRRCLSKRLTGLLPPRPSGRAGSWRTP
eukprot:1634378-Lingulodinium_polyedra.AAC.1